MGKKGVLALLFGLWFLFFLLSVDWGLASAGNSTSVGVDSDQPLGDFPNTHVPGGPEQTGTGWSVKSTPSGVRITWTGKNQIPAGGGWLEVRSGGQLLGIAREQGRSAVLDLPQRSAPPLEELELWRSGRRFDTARVASYSPSSLPPSIPLPSPSLEVQTSDVMDPGAPGPYETERLEYELGGLPWYDPRYEEFPPIEVQAEVTAPVGVPGARPLVVILHGFHTTCYTGGPDGMAILSWPCPPDWEPIPSYRGYRAIADLLASQGSVVVSISANGINGQEWFFGLETGAPARSALIRHHLGLWAQWAANGNDPWGGRFLDAVDLSKVVLVGHSRGGEGVVRAAIDSETSDPWRIRGIVAIAPTAISRQVPPYVQTLVLLPECDGDVPNLSGQSYVDGARDLLTKGDPALRSAALIDGANHAFFNSEWTPGQAEAPAWDDAVVFGSIDNPACMPDDPETSRLHPDEQQAVAATYTAALVKLAVNDDSSMLHFLDGPEPAPPSASGAQVWTTAIGGDRIPLYEPDIIGEATSFDMTECTICSPLDPPPVDLPVCASSEELRLAPHWSPDISPYSARYERPRALQLAWGEDGGTMRIDLDRPVDLRRFDRLDARFVIDRYANELSLTVRLIDTMGRWTDLESFPIQPLPGGEEFRRLWGQALSVELEGLTALHMSQITAIELVFPEQQGSGYLLDVMAVRDRLPEPVGPPIARLDVPDIEVEEGSGPGTATLTVPITGPVRHEGLVWIEVRESNPIPDDFFAPSLQGSYFLSIGPGDDHLEIPVSWEGDEEYNPGSKGLSVSVTQHRNVLTSDCLGIVTVLEDDPPPPPPPVTITDAFGEEATGLSWYVTMSEPMDQPVTIWFTPVPLPPGFGNELSVGDLDPTFVAQFSCNGPAPPETALSLASLCLSIELSPGQTAAEFHLPTIVDGVVEDMEAVLFQVFSYDFGPDPLAFVLGWLSDS